MDVETLKASPVFIYARVLYAAVVIVKLHVSATSPLSQIGVLIDPESLKVDFYLSSIIDRLMVTAGPAKFRSAYMFMGAFTRQAPQVVPRSTETDICLGRLCSRNRGNALPGRQFDTKSRRWYSK